jgi:hypothetical protein
MMLCVVHANTEFYHSLKPILHGRCEAKDCNSVGMVIWVPDEEEDVTISKSE